MTTSDDLKGMTSPAASLRYSDNKRVSEGGEASLQHVSKAKEPGPFRPSVEQLEELLWRDTDEDVCVYALIDGDWADGLYGRLMNSPDLSWAHMFQGRTALDNVQNSPFVVALKRGHRFNRWLLGEGWGQGWGIYFAASTEAALDWYGKPDIRDPLFLPSNQEQIQLGNLTLGQEDPLWLMRRHFRRFSDVEFEDDARIVDFRYYDPATLRIYLLTSTNVELARFFGPTRCFYTDDYSEAESLRSPGIAYCFYAHKNSNVPSDNLAHASLPEILVAIRENVITGENQEVERRVSFKEEVNRKGSVYSLIRVSQIREYEIEQENIFFEKLWMYISYNYYHEIGVNFVKSDLKNLISKAKEYGFRNKSNITYYVIAYLVNEENLNHYINAIDNLHEDDFDEDTHSVALVDISTRDERS